MCRAGTLARPACSGSIAGVEICSAASRRTGVPALHCPLSRKRQIQIGDGLVDLLSILKADRSGIYLRVLESVLHCFHTIIMTVLELTAAAELHANHTQ